MRARKTIALQSEGESRETKLAAAQAYFDTYRVPLLTRAAIERIEAEWRGELLGPPERRPRRARIGT